jgi:hypothetical protein
LIFIEEMYQEYKLATQQFVNWIIQTSKNKKLPNTLNALRLHVQGIISDPTIHFGNAEGFFNELTGALRNGKRAIELRSLVHSIYKSNTSASSDNLESGHGHEEHLFCIKILKECYSSLKTLSVKFERDNEASAKSAASSEGSDFEFLSKFAGLEIEEIAETEDSALNLPTAAVQELNFDDVDLKFGDLRLRFICFFLGLIEMEEQVVNTWKRVKSTDISLISATVVTHFAIQRIKMIHSELSLIYPSYSDATSFFSGLKQFPSPLEYEWVSRHSSFQLFFLIMEFYHHIGGLAGQNKIPLSREFIRCRGSCTGGEIYNECTRSPLESERNQIFSFLDNEVALLLNSMVEARKREGGDYNSFVEQFHLGKDRAFISSYIREFIQYFESWVPTVPLLFLSLCWIRSVQCLEDSNFLFMYKTIYLYRSFIRRRNTNYIVNGKNLEILKQNKSLNPNAVEWIDRLEDMRKSYRSDPGTLRFLQGWTIQHNHPFIAGACFLDLVYEDQNTCTVAMESYSKFHRFLPILYRIFQQNGLIEERIDYMDKYLEIFEKSLLFSGGQSLPNPLDPSFQGFNYKNYLRLCCGVIQPSHTGKPSKMKYENIEKLFPLATKVSKLFAILRNDDFSGFESETVFSKEGIEEIIELTEDELLIDGYLSVDIFKYFISFNMFVVHIGKTSPQIKQLFQLTGQEYGGKFLQWFQQFFIGYVADYLSKPIKVRVEQHPQDTKIVKHFIELMTTYFNDTDKMELNSASEKLDELLFIIPQWETWNKIYLKTFQEAFMWGMDELTKTEPYPGNRESYRKLLSIYWRAAKDLNDPFMKSQRIFDIIDDQIGKNMATIVNMECKGEISYVETEHIDNLLSFFTLTTVHPKMRDIDAAEFVFVTYGCYMYLHTRDAYNIHFPLFTVCHSGNHWAVDLLLSVTPLDAFYGQDPDTGDTVLHIWAKSGRNDLLSRILILGFVQNPVPNKDGRLFTYYIKNPDFKSFMEKELDRWGTCLQTKITKKSLPEQAPVKVYVYPTRNKETAATRSLSLEAGEEKNSRVKSKKNKNKSQDVARVVTEKDQELALQAEKELIAMIEKEEQGQKQNPEKKKHKK